MKWDHNKPKKSVCGSALPLYWYPRLLGLPRILSNAKSWLSPPNSIRSAFHRQLKPRPGGPVRTGHVHACCSLVHVHSF